MKRRVIKRNSAKEARCIRKKMDMEWTRVHADIEERRPVIYGIILDSAAGRHDGIPIMRFCKECGETDFNGALEAAACAGHLNNVKLCVEWGTDDYYGTALGLAIFHKAPADVIRYLYEFHGYPAPS